MGLLNNLGKSIGKSIKEKNDKIDEYIAQYESYSTSRLKSMYSDQNFERRAAIMKILKSRGEWDG